ncbi:MAG: translation initiation factor IF-3 [Patescibacteria group bacterium]
MSKSKRYRTNQQIRVPEVFVIDDNNNRLGVMATDRAMNLAREQEIDLVEVAPNAKPPVCRIIDYGAFIYHQEKTERKQKARQKKTDVKGIRLTFNVGEHDRNMLIDRARKFISQGHKVKIEMLLRGRQRAYQDRAYTMLKEFGEAIADLARPEQDISRQGHKFFIILTRK